MKTLKVPHLSFLSRIPIETVSATLDSLERHTIDQLPWNEFQYKPSVYFSVAHAGDRLFLKYFISETNLRALYFRPNEPVYKDSCVEFFIALNGDPAYYNFEFNAIGTCKLNFGTGRNERKLISEQVISNIRFFSCIGNDVNNGLLSWHITIAIPVNAFTEHRVTSLQGYRCRGNFYKCGDDLPNPHFLSWNFVDAPSPDFHIPGSFGEISFE